MPEAAAIAPRTAPLDRGEANRAYIQTIARACHEANRIYCLAIGDTSQQPWDEAEESQRASVCHGVVFALNNPDASPSAQHDAWSCEKIAAGWVHGPVKDAEAKTHPCLVPYKQLPAEQQAKDIIFRETVAHHVRRMQGRSSDLAFAVGDVAILRSNGPKMTVEAVTVGDHDDEFVDCIWFPDETTGSAASPALNRDRFPAATLRKLPA